ncbi:MAG: zinc-binding dehydrogenase [Bacillota bacterium]
MKTKAVRLYGASDLRLEEFELPEIKEDEILVEVISDSVCMSTYKCAILGKDHKRVPDNVAEAPVIMGHEMAGNIVKVGSKYKGQFHEGRKFTLQPALNYKGTMWSPGYSYQYFGGNATYCIIPQEVMELGCFFEYGGENYFEASLAEPLSCSVGAFHASFHTTMGSYVHEMGIRKGGKLAILAGAGPMGLGAIDYAISGEIRPSYMIVVDIDAKKLARAKDLFEEKGKQNGVTIEFVNTAGVEDVKEFLLGYSKEGFDDVFVYAPVVPLIELADRILARDGCLNFFAGPTDTDLRAKVNFYNVHYNSSHLIGTTGGNTADLVESLELSAAGKVNPAVMVTHIGGIDACADAILNLPKIPGGKKMIYNHINMPLTDLEDFAKIGETDERYAVMDKMIKANNGLWCGEAERYLLANF